MFKTYYQLTKPGIIYGNALTAIAGFLLATRVHIYAWLLLETLVGISLIIASACVFNNYIDRDIDKKMSRTKNRAFVKKTVPVKNALIYATILGLVGFSVLAFFTNFLTVLVGIVGYLDYVLLYGIAKRHSVHGTLVGSISGAMPPIAGYTAAANRFDIGALLLFIIVVLWQMPHFYAIAMYRYDDYAAAKLPVLPIVKGLRATKIQVLLYIIAFIVATAMLTVFGFTGYSYAAVIVGLGLAWLWLGLQGFRAKNDAVWARKMFLFSLVIILSLSIMIPLGTLLP